MTRDARLHAPPGTDGDPCRGGRPGVRTQSTRGRLRLPRLQRHPDSPGAGGGGEDRAFRALPGADCPTIDAAAAPFENLRAFDPDLSVAVRRQAAFRANWRRHFLRLNTLVPALAIDEFTARLDLSLEWNIWSYVGLADAEIPIVLALLDEFSPYDAMPAQLARTRDHWYRFWVSHDGVDDADWPWPNGGATVSRGRFRARGQGIRPVGADFIDLEIIPVSGTFLEGPEPPTLHDYRENAVNAWLARHPAFGL